MKSKDLLWAGAFCIAGTQVEGHICEILSTQCVLLMADVTLRQARF